MKVFVHGNPECDAIWDPLRAALADRGLDDVVTLSPPGFGAAVPPGFEATPRGYVEWLEAELGTLDGPVDLLGHDWGAGHVLGLATHRPDLIRSWAVDCAGLIHPDYVWHDLAQAWQQPEVGEAAVAGLLEGSFEDKQAIFLGLGLPPGMAARLAEAADAEMGACVLTLYRAAVQPFMRELGDRLAAAEARPSLVVVASEDAYVPATLSRDAALRFGARVLSLEGQGHWWMVHAPDRAAEGLARFWTELD